MRDIQYAVCFGIAVVACLIVSPSASAEEIIRCRSNDYQYTHCPTQERGQIRLTQQISKSDCIEGRTWGYDRRGIWVDQGCDAKFQVVARRRDRHDRHDQNDQDGRRGDKIVCRSDGFAYNHCRANAIGKGSKVRLTEQISETRCIRNKTWGTDKRGIWVDQGCEAEFKILPLRNNRVVGGKDTLRCSSENYAYEHCRADTRAGVRLLRNLSKVRCIENESWGYDRRGVWVDEGCSAEFRVLARGSGNESDRGSPAPLSSNAIRCRSDSFDYEHCRADTQRGVQLSRQLSQTACIQGESWGYDRRGVWVDRGCEAEFMLGQTARNSVQNPVGNTLGQALENLLAPPR